MQHPGPVRTSIIGARAPIFRGACVTIGVGVLAHLPMLAMGQSERETRGRSLRELEGGS